MINGGTQRRKVDIYYLRSPNVANGATYIKVLVFGVLGHGMLSGKATEHQTMEPHLRSNDHPGRKTRVVFFLWHLTPK